MGGFLWTILKRRLQKTLFSMQAPRLIVQVSLLIAFLHFFGIPAIARFAKKGVVVVETARDTDGIPIPAITLAAFGQITDDACFHKNASIEDCFEKNTLNRSDILKSVILGYSRQQKINLTQEILTEDFTTSWVGRFFTLNLPLKIGPNDWEDQIFLGLNTNLTCTVFVHDPEYFMLNVNPIALPISMRKFATKMTKPNGWVYRLELTEVNRLNRPSSPCNDDPSYNFRSCLRRSISAKVFC